MVQSLLRIRNDIWHVGKLFHDTKCLSFGTLVIPYAIKVKKITTLIRKNKTRTGVVAAVQNSYPDPARNKNPYPDPAPKKNDYPDPVINRKKWPGPGQKPGPGCNHIYGLKNTDIFSLQIQQIYIFILLFNPYANFERYRTFHRHQMSHGKNITFLPFLTWKFSKFIVFHLKVHKCN